MPRNGNGEYILPAGNPVIPGTVIEAEWANNTMNDLAAALTDSLTADGQTTPISNLPMGGFHHTGVSNPTLRNQYATLGMSQDGGNIRVHITSGVDNLVGTLVGQASAYVAGAMVSFFAPADNTGPMTLNYNGIGARSLVAADGSALEAGNIKAGQFLMALYNGSAFVLISVVSDSNTALFQTSTTGWIRPPAGDYPTLTIATATTINVPAGSGYIVPPGSSGSETATFVQWNAQTIELQYLATSFSTSIAVDETGTITQSPGRWIGSAVRTSALIGVVQHFNGIAASIQTQPAIFGDDGYLSRATSSLMAGQIISGCKVTANTASPLQMDIGGGLIFQPGASSNTADSPNTLTLPSQNSLPFRTLAGESTAGTTTIITAPVTQYDPNGAGVVTTIPQNADTVIHRLYYLYGQYVWVFGQFIYTSLTDALNRIEVDRTNRITSTKLSGATLLAEIICNKNATGLKTTTSVIIARGAAYFSIGSTGGISEAPVNGQAYGRQDAGWVPVVKSANPAFTGSATLTGASPTMTQVLSTPGTGTAGYVAKQGAYDWMTITPVAADDKTYFRSYNPVNGNLRNTTTWDLATGDWDFPGDVTALTFNGAALPVFGTAASANVTTSATDTTEGRVLKVGDFGLGGNTPLASDLNVISTGFWDFNNTTANRPFDYGRVYCARSNDVTQIAVSVTDSRITTRKFQAGFGWSAWVEVATSANSLGQGQTWQDVTGSRVVGTTYTNSTGKPIQVEIGGSGLPVCAVTPTVNGVALPTHRAYATGYTQKMVASFIVPTGGTYSVSIPDGALEKWTELR